MSELVRNTEGLDLVFIAEMGTVNTVHSITSSCYFENEVIGFLIVLMPPSLRLLLF